MDIMVLIGDQLEQYDNVQVYEWHVAAPCKAVPSLRFQCILCQHIVYMYIDRKYPQMEFIPVM